MRSSVPPSEPPPDAWQEYLQRIAEAPETGTVRGMFFSELLRLAPALQLGDKRRYLPFSKYPVRSYMQLLIDVGRRVHPASTPEESLRALGAGSFATFASSMAGMSLLSGAHEDSMRLLEIVPKAYPLAIEPGHAAVVSCSKHEGVFKLRDVWTFPESYHVGIWLSGLEALGLTGEIGVIRHSWCNVDFHVRWRKL